MGLLRFSYPCNSFSIETVKMALAGLARSDTKAVKNCKLFEPKKMFELRK